MARRHAIRHLSSACAEHVRRPVGGAGEQSVVMAVAVAEPALGKPTPSPAPMSSTPSPWVLGARSETGYVRSANEDRMGWTRTPYGDVFVVSDGMGGHLGGALAAEITLRTLQQQLALIPPASDRFADHVRQAFLAANRDV